VLALLNRRLSTSLKTELKHQLVAGYIVWNAKAGYGLDAKGVAPIGDRLSNKSVSQSSVELNLSTD
jgi:hypothetical protein